MAARNAERDARSVYVANLPTTPLEGLTLRDELKAFFGTQGEVEFVLTKNPKR